MNDHERHYLFDCATPGVQGLQPYQPGKPLSELEREYGVRDAVKLASNENPLGPSPRVIEAIRSHFDALARYPDGNGFSLKRVLSNRHDVAIPQITLGNGSNDVLEIIARTFLAPGRSAVFSEHAFAVYPIVTQAIGATAKMAPARDYGHDLDAMLSAVDETTGVVFIANPNNPTGTWLTGEAIEDFLEKVPERVIVVLDEAYVEYVREKAFPDSLPYLDRYPNVVLTRTFSKAYGLAGLRVGYALSSPVVADLINRVRQPFNVNTLALIAAEVALGDQEHIAESVRVNDAGMLAWQGACERLGLDYIPSVGNFICVDVGRPAGDVYEALLREGVIVRPVPAYGLPNHLRITIGTEAENTRAIAALEKVLR